VTLGHYKHVLGVVGVHKGILGEGDSEVVQGFDTEVAGFGGVYGAFLASQHAVRGLFWV
jgi:hypothetical protein